MLLKIEKYEKIEILAVSALNTISNLISKALSDNSISDEEYSLLLLEFETFTWIKEDLSIKSKTNVEKTGNIEAEANVLFNRNTTTILTWSHVQSHVQNHVQTMFKTMFKTVFKTAFKTTFETLFETMFDKLKICIIKTCNFQKKYRS